MKSWSILSNGMVAVPVYIAYFSNKEMRRFSFIFDTGASFTVINKGRLLNMGYTADWFEKSKDESADVRKVKIANGKSVEIYRLPKIQLSIGEYVFYDEFLYTSDEVAFPNNLLGWNMIKYFDVYLKNSEGLAYFNLLESGKKFQECVGDPFVYRIK